MAIACATTVTGLWAAGCRSAVEDFYAPLVAPAECSGKGGTAGAGGTATGGRGGAAGDDGRSDDEAVAGAGGACQVE